MKPTRRIRIGIADGLETLARVTGLEPATSGVTGRRSNQLSYTRNRGGAPSKASRAPRQAMRRMGGDGIEPPTLSV